MTLSLCSGGQEDIGRGVCMDWLAEAQELSEAGQPFALATVVRRVAPASAQPGAKALILPNGSMRGWVGGSCAQPVVTSEARQALREGTPRLLRLGTMPGASHKGKGQAREDIVEYPMTCHSGGALEILIEPVLPAPRLFIVGETPVVETLADLARVTGYRVNQFERAAGLALRLGDSEAPVFVVVASMGVDDEEALAAALRLGTPYVALVASPKRAAVVCETLAAMGVSPDDLVRLKAPAGLDIGARTQEEIALSIIAEITQIRSAMTPRTAEAAAAPGPNPVAALELEAVDPVCGMIVIIAGARHQTAYDGKTWYFCCGGCKARFEADPLPYLPA
jgi:xanthine dehydrogenase accessory factor